MAKTGEVLRLAIAVTVLSALGNWSASAATPPSDDLKKAGEITFCTELGQPPAAYLAEDGVGQEGFEVDIMRAIGKELGLKTVITNFKFAGIFAALDSSKCDAVMASASKSPARLEKYIFVDYMQGTSGLLVPAGNPKGLKTFEDLSGRRVGVLLGSANEARLKQASEKAQAAGGKAIDIVSYTSNAVAFQELELSRLDAFVSGSLTLAYWMTKSGGKFEIGGSPVPPVTFGIVLSKTATAKAEAIKAAYAALIKDGTINRIVNRWGAQEGALLCDGTRDCN